MAYNRKLIFLLLFFGIIAQVCGDSSVTKRSGKLKIGDTWNPPTTAFDNNPANCKKDSNGENSYQHFEVEIDHDGMIRIIASFDEGIADTARISVFKGSSLDTNQAAACKGHVATVASDPTVYPSIDAVVQVTEGTYQIVIYSTLKNSGSSKTATQYIVHIAESIGESWSTVVDPLYIVPQLGNNCTSSELLAAPSSVIFTVDDQDAYDVYAYVFNDTGVALYPTLSLYKGEFVWSNTTQVDPCNNASIAANIIDTQDYATSFQDQSENRVRISARLEYEQSYTAVVTIPVFFDSQTHGLFVVKSVVGDTSASTANYAAPITTGGDCQSSSTMQKWENWVFEAENADYHIFPGDDFEYDSIQVSLYRGNNSGQSGHAPNTCEDLIATSSGLIISSLEQGETYTVVVATNGQYSLYIMTGSVIVEDPLTKATKITMLVVGIIIGIVVFGVVGVLFYYTWWIPNKKYVKYKIDRMFDKQWEPLTNEEDTTFSVYDPDEEDDNNPYN